MTAEHRRLSGELLAWHACEIIRRLPLTAANLNPSEINPYRVGPAKSKAMIELEQWQARRAWGKIHQPKGRYGD